MRVKYSWVRWAIEDDQMFCIFFIAHRHIPTCSFFFSVFVLFCVYRFFFILFLYIYSAYNAHTDCHAMYTFFSFVRSFTILSLYSTITIIIISITWDFLLWRCCCSCCEHLVFVCVSVLRARACVVRFNSFHFIPPILAFKHVSLWFSVFGFCFCNTSCLCTAIIDDVIPQRALFLSICNQCAISIDEHKICLFVF